MHPLTWAEVPGFDLLRALNRGLIPSNYDSAAPRRTLAGYVDDYLKEEVFEEGLTRNAPAFARFFEALAFCHGELMNYSPRQAIVVCNGSAPRRNADGISILPWERFLERL